MTLTFTLAAPGTQIPATTTASASAAGQGMYEIGDHSQTYLPLIRS